MFEAAVEVQVLGLVVFERRESRVNESFIARRSQDLSWLQTGRKDRWRSPEKSGVTVDPPLLTVEEESKG